MKIRANNNNGFTLIETVISLGVLSIGILALFAMQTLGIRANASASRVTKSATYGGYDIEQILPPIFKYDKVISREYFQCNDNTKLCSKGNNTNDYCCKSTVFEDTPIKDIKTIDVTVTKYVDGEADGKESTLRYLKARPKKSVK